MTIGEKRGLRHGTTAACSAIYYLMGAGIAATRHNSTFLIRFVFHHLAFADDGIGQAQARNGFGQGLLEAVDFNLHILRIAGNDFGQRGYQVAGGEAVQVGQTVIAEGVAIDAQGGGHFDSHPTQGIFLEDLFVGKEVDLPRLRLANAPGAAAGKVV